MRPICNFLPVCIRKEETLMKQKLVTNSDFLRLTVPAGKKEMSLLEKSLMEDGCQEPVIIWNGTVLDGHKRVKFCRCEGIDFRTEEMNFPTHEDAVAWVCRRRLQGLPARKHIYRYLVGRLYLAQKELYIRSYQNDTKPRAAGSKPKPPYSLTRDVLQPIASEYGMAPETVYRFAVFAGAVDRIAGREPELARAILSEEVTLKREDVVELADKEDRKITRLRRKLLPARDTGMRKRAKVGAEKEIHSVDDDGTEPGIPLRIGIKDMPVYDPDMELKGLALTIPTWIAAIARSESRTDMALASDKAKEQLVDGLLRLEGQIHSTLEAIECRKKES